MTTALDIIKRAMRLDGVLSIGETPSSEEAQDCMEALNSMIESMSNEGLLIYVQALDSITLTVGDPTYTVGPTGDVVSERPIKVLDSSYIQYNNASYPLRILNVKEYNALTLKTTGTSIPNMLYPQYDMPNVTLNLYPVPSTAVVLKLESNKIIQSFANLTTSVTLPPGYTRMLAYNLAVEIAPEFEAQVRPDVMQIATTSRRIIKRTNTKPTLLKLPYGVGNKKRGAMILNG